MSSRSLARPLDAAAMPARVTNWRCPTPMRVALAVFTVSAVGRVGDVIPQLYAIPIAKICAVVLVISGLMSPPSVVARVRKHVSVPALLIVLALTLLSVPTSLWMGQSVEFLISSWFPVVVYFLAAVVGFTDERAMLLSVRAVVVTVVALSAKLVAGKAEMVVGRAYTGSLDPNDTAALFVATIPLALWLAAMSKRRLVTLAWYGAAIAILAGVVKTGSRGGMLGLFTVSACLLVFAPRSRRILYGALVAVGAVVFVATASPELRERYLSTFSADEDYNATSSEGRLEIWKRGMGYMVQRPVTGVGVGAFGVAEGTLAGKAERSTSVRFTAAHNSFVQISAELGVLGMLTFITVVVLTLRGAYRTRRRAVAWQRAAGGAESDRAVTSATGVLTALAGLLTCATFLSFAYHPLLWYCFALCVGVEIANERRMAGAYRASQLPGGWRPAFLARRPGMRGGLAAGGVGPLPGPSIGPS